MKTFDILKEFNESNSSNYKLEVMKKYKANDEFKKVLSLALDRVKYTFGISMKNIKYTPESGRPISLSSAMTILEEEFNTRKVTGNAAIAKLQETLSNLSKEDAYVLERIISRDLKINFGRSQVNKILKDHISKPKYCRCGTYTEKAGKKINYPAIIQKKCDGKYMQVTVDNNEVTFNARSGEESEFPILKDIFSYLPNGVYMGEMLIKDLENRSEANGLLNSDDIPHDKVYMDLWDYLTLEEYTSGNFTTFYEERFDTLIDNIDSSIDSKQINIVDYKSINTLREALEYTSELMTQGFEGGVLKDRKQLFKDGTSSLQLKLKLIIEATVRIKSFVPGNKGSKNEKYFSAITFETDDGMVKGQVGVTSMTEKVRDELFAKKDVLIDELMEVEFNDLSKARGNNYYACSHPRYAKLRPDITETDDLERVLATREMSMQLGNTK